MNRDERRLGMGARITRRDFLNGAAFAVGGALAGRGAGAAQLAQPTGSRYPPALTGLRGSHAGSFEALHAMRDEQFWLTAPAPHNTREEYDLVGVGAGISGLAAAYFYRRAHPGARVLVLDNHDDFGGHAKRNEFTHRGRTYLGYGGTQSIDSPSPYSAVAKGLIGELGIDVASYPQALDASLYPALGLRRGWFFDRETFGADRLVVGDPPEQSFLAGAPLSAAAKRDLVRLLTERFDPMPGLGSAEKRARLARMSYADFLTQHWHLDPGVLWPYQTSTHGLFGVGVDAVPAQDAFGLGLPGFAGMDLDPAPGPGQNLDAIRTEDAQRYYFHFPDGNATITRLLVRSLVPSAIPGEAVADVVTARADYSRLDREGSPVRVRLRSPVVRVRHLAAATARSAGQVEVAYLRGGALETVTGRSVVLACWHTVIPAICPELPAAQKAALQFAIKVPLVYTNVFIRSWLAFRELGVQRMVTPAMWHTSVELDFPVSIGSYRHQTDPTKPIVLHLAKAACSPGLPVREQHRAGRRELLETPFPAIERSIRDQLDRAIGAGGFAPARDILAITVNRWPHGYAYQYNSLSEDFWLTGGEQPCAVARRPHGRIAIANADSAAYSYTDAAIDQAHRAVHELLAGD